MRKAAEAAWFSTSILACGVKPTLITVKLILLSVCAVLKVNCCAKPAGIVIGPVLMFLAVPSILLAELSKLTLSPSLYCWPPARLLTVKLVPVKSAFVTDSAASPVNATLSKVMVSKRPMLSSALPLPVTASVAPLLVLLLPASCKLLALVPSPM